MTTFFNNNIKHSSPNHESIEPDNNGFSSLFFCLVDMSAGALALAVGDKTGAALAGDKTAVGGKTTGDLTTAAAAAAPVPPDIINELEFELRSYHQQHAITLDIRGAFGCLSPTVAQIREMIQKLQVVCDNLNWPTQGPKTDVVYVSDTKSTFVINKPSIIGACVKDCDLLAIGDHPSSLVQALQSIHTVIYATVKSKIIYPLLFIKPVNVVVRGWVNEPLDLRELFNTDNQKRLQHPSKLDIYSKTLEALPQSISSLDSLSIKTHRISNDSIQSLLSIPTGTLQQLSLNFTEPESIPFLQQLIHKSPATKKLELVVTKPKRWFEHETTDRKHSQHQPKLPETFILNQPLTTSFICSREWLHYDMKVLSRVEFVFDDSKWMTTDRMMIWWKALGSRAVNLKTVKLLFRLSSAELTESVLVVVTALVTMKHSTLFDVITVDPKCQLQLSELILNLFGASRYERLKLLMGLCQTNIHTHRNATICALKCESLLAYTTDQFSHSQLFVRRQQRLEIPLTKEEEKELTTYQPLNKWSCIDAITKVSEPTSAPTLSISNHTNKKESLIISFPYF